MVRFNFSAAGHLAGQVLSKVLEEAAARDVEAARALEGETLWEFFHRVQFWDSASRLLTPVVVLDQFEDLFTLAEGDERVELFMQELADLIENRML